MTTGITVVFTPHNLKVRSQALVGPQLLLLLGTQQQDSSVVWKLRPTLTSGFPIQPYLNCTNAAVHYTSCMVVTSLICFTC